MTRSQRLGARAGVFVKGRIMIDGLDIMAFAVIGVLLVAGVIVAVTVGGLPGKIAWQRGHPQAAAVTAAGWMGLATLGLLWPLALIWALYLPASAPAPPREFPPSK